MSNKTSLKTPLKILYILLAFAVWAAIWQIAASITGDALLLPRPLDVINRFIELAKGADFYKIVLFSMLRVICGTVAAVICGVILATLTARFEMINLLIKPLMTVIKSTPVASFIILALVWFSRAKLPIFVVFLIVLPVVWANVHTGIKNTDKKLIEMVKVFKVAPLKKLTMLYIPSVIPYFNSSLMTSIGLAWKAGIAAEVLASPTLSIGKMLFESKQYLETVDLFAWTLTVIIMSLIIEYILELMSKKLIFGKHAKGAKE